MRVVSLSVASLLAASPLALSAITGINSTWTGGSNFAVDTINDEGGTALTAGTTAIGDGAIVQFGVFWGVSTTLDPADYTDAQWRSFTPLTGLGSVNPHITTSIGDARLYPTEGTDSALPDGFYDIGVTFDTSPASGPAASGLPGNASRVGIRILNETILAASTEANTVTSFDTAWVMPAASENPTLPANASLDAGDINPNPPLIWRNGPASAFMTPEPSTSLLGLLGALVLLRRRR